MNEDLADVQNQRPENEIELEKVGIEGLKKYVIIRRPDKTFHAIVTINSYVTLPSNLRGAHMSRFAESIAETPVETSSIEDLAEEIARKAYQKHGFHSYTEVFGEFPYRRIRPNGGEENAIAEMFGRFSTKNGRKFVGVSISGVLACPCSKELTGGLTHNQRGKIIVEIDVSNCKVDLLDVIRICEDSFSSPTFSILKRTEEREVVKKIHENPMFVEDVVRKCVQLLREKFPGRYCRVKCISYESIHDHNVCSEWSGIL